VVKSVQLAVAAVLKVHQQLRRVVDDPQEVRTKSKRSRKYMTMMKKWSKRRMRI
jgi:hypothetical protein